MSATRKGRQPVDAARNQTRAITAGVAGNVMEWFDFAVYGYFAPVIGMQFFPAENPVTSLLASFGVFASGFLARPVGAAFFGHLGDRYGRNVVLRLSVLVMGAATFAMGLLPTYAMVGIAARRSFSHSCDSLRGSPSVENTPGR